MRVLSIVSLKGGVGKTTLATALAVSAIKEGKNVLLIALQEEKEESSLEFWRKIRNEYLPLVKSISSIELNNVLKWAHFSKFDLVIIDAPRTEVATRVAANFADFVIIPTKTSFVDLFSTIKTIDMLKLLNKRFSTVLTFCSHDGKEDIHAEDILQKRAAEVCPVKIFKRRAHPDSQLDGRCVLEYEPKGKAAVEVKALYNYIHRRLWDSEIVSKFYQTQTAS